MSYSISARGANKTAAKADVAAKLDVVVVQQPIHARDRDAALTNASAIIDLLADDESKDVVVSCSGSVSTSDGALASVNVACSAALVQRPAD